MKVLFLSHSDLQGGAARATYRIFKSLEKNGVELKMLVKQKISDDESVVNVDSFHTPIILGEINKFRSKFENLYYKTKLNKYSINEDSFISNLSSININEAIFSISYDILHLNWVSHQYLDINLLKKIKTPIVWTLHDCWAFTGICHYVDNCNHYTKSCGSCRLLGSNDAKDLSNEIWQKKKRSYELCNMHIITPSQWLGRIAAQSSLLHDKPISVIPYPINTDFFKPRDKITSRQQINLKRGGKFVLFGAMNALNDHRKGYHFVLEAIKLLASQGHDDIHLLIFGTSESYEEINDTISIRYINSINNDDELIDLYSAVDVTVVPSVSENLSLVIMESLACGTPVVAFNIGGNSDLIEHKSNGYLATPYSVEEVAKGIVWCLDEAKVEHKSSIARQKVLDDYSEHTIAEKYLKLYNSII